ncbi:MAG: peptide-methionine (R)-S-oxide reductase MsrB [Hyphomicrobiaceae bacterium]|nr:peptide-methionine (R)-S-oxide reductase MsrB [Hyphomicrobiaceae bacterium]
MITRRTLAVAGLAAAGVAGFTRAGSRAAEPEKEFAVKKSPEEWRKVLTPQQFYVLREHGTERAGSSPLDKTYAPGLYRCAGCGQDLFASDTKFDSGTGWPSFFAPIEGAIGTKSDRSFFMLRTEVHCSRCGGHLGHVFEDGPQPTGLRYCMNGIAMTFVPADKAVEKSGS